MKSEIELAQAYAALVEHDIHVPTCARIIEENGLSTLDEVRRFFEHHDMPSKPQDTA